MYLLLKHLSNLILLLTIAPRFSLPASCSPVHVSRFAFCRPRVIWLAIILPILLVVPASAQTPEDAKVDFYIDPADADKPLTVGDHITLRLEVRHPADSNVVLPRLEREWAEFEVVEQTPPETVAQPDGVAVTGKAIIVSLFEPGQYLTPRLVITHRQADGSVEELAAPVIALNITSVLTEDGELRDLKPQAELPEPPLWPWLVGGSLLAMLLSGLLFGAALWYYHYRRIRPLPAAISAPVIDTRPPEVIAHAELDRIEALDLPAQNKIKEHYSLVTNCLRVYIEQRYHIPALEQTTAELRAAFRQSTVPMRDVAAFMSLFSEGDFVKFARYQPQLTEVYSLIGRARVIVDATTPAPTPAEPVESLRPKPEAAA
jgi:hypothetical protein